ncbi:MAG: hypothetical protein R2724_34350 [Bryobacterales bacterium]
MKKKNFFLSVLHGVFLCLLSFFLFSQYPQGEDIFFYGGLWVILFGFVWIRGNELLDSVLKYVDMFLFTIWSIIIVIDIIRGISKSVDLQVGHYAALLGLMILGGIFYLAIEYRKKLE